MNITNTRDNRSAALATALLAARTTWAATPDTIEPDVTLESPQLKVVFDGRTKALALLGDKANNDQQHLSVSEDFSFLLSRDGLDTTVAASNSTITGAKLSDRNFTVMYGNSNGAVTVRHTLGQTGHCLRKDITFAPAFSGNYAVKRVKTGVFGTPNNAVRVVHQHGAGAYTYFLRKANNGYFFGVQVIPGIPISTAEGTPVELQYEANIKLLDGEPYDVEPSFFGCYTKTGHAYSKLPDLHRCPTSPVGLDDGEAEAVLAMVADLAPNRHIAPITIHLNGWQSGITIAESSYQDPAIRKLLLIARDMLGPGFYFESASPWFGHMARLPDLTPSDAVVPYQQPDEKEFLDWMHQNGIKSFLWTPTGQASAWHKVPRYCQTNEEFRLPGNAQNCVADHGFMSWLTRIVVNELKKGHDGWGHDEEGAAVNYTGYTCQSPNHTHPAGANVSYACFRERQTLRKAIRKIFGEDYELNGSRPDADTGIWDALPLTTLCTYGENGNYNDSPLKIRYGARARHFCHFIPSWVHQVPLYTKQPGRDLDKLMLSALAVSSSFILCDGVDFPGQDRVKYWLDWARANGDYMRVQAHYLPQWPSEGVDGYVRVNAGRGYAFVFNDYGEDSSIAIPLGASVGLDSAKTYTISQLFPLPADPSAIQAKGVTTFPLKAGEYRLLSIVSAEK